MKNVHNRCSYGTDRDGALHRPAHTSGASFGTPPKPGRRQNPGENRENVIGAAGDEVRIF